MSAVRKKKPVADPWLSLLAASRELGVPRQSVLLRALKGEVEYQIAAGRVLISRASVERAKECEA